MEDLLLNLGYLEPDNKVRTLLNLKTEAEAKKSGIELSESVIKYAELVSKLIYI